ncbi:MAG: hypothetical protein HY445_02965 [Candidatus Niyogibacteria bacterium]|nr:hypothetical protein [Candidatus Niyogibacteria bacterium]
MKEYAALIVAMIWLSGHAFYIYQIVRKKIFPTLSTWIIFSTATGLGLANYLVASNKDIVSGVLIASDAFASFVVVMMVALFTYSGLKFKPFEKYYLVGAGFIVLFWMITGSAFIANLLTQTLIAVGYLPTIQNLIRAEKNPESLVVWSLDIIAASISLYPAIVGGNLLASIYSVRAVIMLSFVVLLMIRLSIKNKGRNKK